MSEFALGAYVCKHTGAFWEGVVVGHYGTKQTEDGVAVQLFGWEDGPVQIYPAAALQLCDPAQSRLAPPLPIFNLTDEEMERVQESLLTEKPRLAVFRTPPPSTHLDGDPANKAEAILRIVRKMIAAENAHAEKPHGSHQRVDLDFLLMELVGFTTADVDQALRIVRRCRSPSPQPREVGG